MKVSTHLAMITAALVALAATSCDDGPAPIEPPPPAPLPVPDVSALSVTAARVGEEVQFYGEGFVSPDIGWTEITWRGVYTHDGIAEPVNLTVEVGRETENTAVWRFGPYQIPFTPAGNHLGTFEGEIFATNYSYDGREQRQQADFRTITFDVLPSLIVRDITAEGEGFRSDCRFVGTRLINLVPYRMTVEAVGFEADEFIYSVSEGMLNDSGPSDVPNTFNHLAASNIDTLGDIEQLRFAEVPLGVPVYAASISVDAISLEGEHFEQFVRLTVHEPIYVRYRGGVEVAEIMEAVPVSGCIPGGVQGRQLTYSETVVEQRTIGESHSMTAGWTDSYTSSHTDTYGESGEEANRIGFSSADMSNWNWNINGSVMAGGEAGVPLVTKGKVEVRVGGGRDWGGSHTDTRSGEQSWKQVSSYSRAVSETNAHSDMFNESNTEIWQVSTATSELRGFSAFLLPNHYGVWYRQTTRLVRRAEIVAMDLCGNETVVGELLLNEYTWAPDLAMGAECSPFPESLLPPAECLIPPCEEVTW